MINEGIVNVSYIIATILFILALKGLTHPSTARRGNFYGMAGMALAIVATLLGSEVQSYGFIIAGADVRHVPMTPEHDFFEELNKAIEESWPRPKMLVVNFPGKSPCNKAAIGSNRKHEWVAGRTYGTLRGCLGDETVIAGW